MTVAVYPFCVVTGRTGATGLGDAVGRTGAGEGAGGTGCVSGRGEEGKGTAGGSGDVVILMKLGTIDIYGFVTRCYQYSAGSRAFNCYGEFRSDTAYTYGNAES